MGSRELGRLGIKRWKKKFERILRQNWGKKMKEKGKFDDHA